MKREKKNYDISPLYVLRVYHVIKWGRKQKIYLFFSVEELDKLPIVIITIIMPIDCSNEKSKKI